jgi:PAS domain S-box-containing protein
MTITGRQGNTHHVADRDDLGGARDELSSGDALFTFDSDLRIVCWNRAAERLTGFPADDVVGRLCWEVLGGYEGSGAMVCHAGCSYARLAREGWPIPSREIDIRTEEGRRRVLLSTIGLRSDRSLFAHVLIDARERPTSALEEEVQSTNGRSPSLTPRQLQILNKLGEGVPAKVIARELGLSETTVRNHIRAILLELDCHSQLAAVAKARKLGVI